MSTLRLRYVELGPDAEAEWARLSDLERTRIEIVLARVALKALRTDGGPFTTATHGFTIEGSAGHRGQKILVCSLRRSL